MAKRITFQFEDDLDYQMQAIHSTVELFRGLSRHVDGIYRPKRIRKFGEGDPIRNNDIVVGSRLLENLRKVQLSNNLFADSSLVPGKAPTVETPCLFLTYYANAYFGIAQCCQIDAIRSIIGQLEDERTRYVLLTMLMSVIPVAGIGFF